MDIGTESRLEILLSMNRHIRAVTVHLTSFHRSLPLCPSPPSILAFNPMSVIRQETSTSQHSNDITVENKRTSSNHSISKETYEADPACEVAGASGTSEDDYPDGGLRAWLIVAGVSR